MALPLEDQGFALYKSAFWDALAIRYNWLPDRMPTRCACNEPFTVEHALSCPKGTFPIHHHNEIRDITCSLLTEVSHDVTVEPTLQPLDGHTLRYASAITDDGARADVQAKGFWGTPHQRTFFDVKVFNPHAPSTKGFSSLPAMPIMNESNSACMSRGSVKLSWHTSLHSFSAPLEAWANPLKCVC